jgi:hypothetical protein
VRGLPPIAAGEAFRVRRWDAVILGSALPGLITAIRLGMCGIRVLILEEERAAAAFPGLREPFLMTGSGTDGLLGDCLNALGVPLIDRRRLSTHTPAFQVVLPKARIDVGGCGGGGGSDRTAEELEIWKLASGSVARELVSALREEAETQRHALLAAGLFNGGSRLPRIGARGAAEPQALSPSGEQPLAAFFDAQLRALSDFAQQQPTTAVRSRLLGAALGGAADFSDGTRWLREMLEQRIRALYGEIRQIGSQFKLVSAGDRPAVALKGSANVCAGRALIINAPLPTLREAVDGDSIPDLLKGPSASHQRLTVHLRARRRLLPEAMATRVIWIGDPDQEISGSNLIRLRLFDDGKEGDWVDFVASAVVPTDADAKRVREEIESAVASLLPLGREGLERVKEEQPRWDRDELLADPPGAGNWPAGGSLRPISRLPAYLLDRWRSGALGFEGDLLLGWRAGDAIAADLS